MLTEKLGSTVIALLTLAVSVMETRFEMKKNTSANIKLVCANTRGLFLCHMCSNVCHDHNSPRCIQRLSSGNRSSVSGNVQLEKPGFCVSEL
ncbi:unnamed protein product [Lasius platythorax]|uniref:Secreted protein n=1 Tax=Lasius platythorax TaxID=488582 RepID=A0AAV2N5W7_9HYME